MNRNKDRILVKIYITLFIIKKLHHQIYAMIYIGNLEMMSNIHNVIAILFTKLSI